MKYRPNPIPGRPRTAGFTLIEIMIAVAILSIIAALAIPAYRGYIREARLGTARNNAETLRIFLEDFRLDFGHYRVNGSTSFDPEDNAIQPILGWSPDGDQDAFTYQVTASAAAATTVTYSVLVEWSDNVWIFCEDRMANCCDSETTGATKTNCP